MLAGPNVLEIISQKEFGFHTLFSGFFLSKGKCFSLVMLGLISDPMF